MDTRKAIKNGELLILGQMTYRIQEVIGCGSNAFVYKAAYKDSLMPDKEHIVLIKELFPLHQEGLIFRGTDQAIIIDEKAEEFFNLHKESYLRGNLAHIELQEALSDKTSMNINSFSKNGTIYTIMSYVFGMTLRQAMQEGIFTTLTQLIICTLDILNSLKIFHDQGILHLDISPDNILLLHHDEEKSERLKSVQLIDYNSVWSLEELTNHKGLYYSVKEPYSAPEVRLADSRSICPATDIYSVCVLFLECITGTSFSFNELNKLPELEGKILEDAAGSVKFKLNKIIKHGLRLPPGQRFQNVSELILELEELIDIIENDKATKAARCTHRLILYNTIAGILIIGIIFYFISMPSGKYPKTKAEKSLVNLSMNALVYSIGLLDQQFTVQKEIIAEITEQIYQNDESTYNDWLVFINKKLEHIEMQEYNINENELILQQLEASGSPIKVDVLSELYMSPLSFKEQINDIQTRILEYLSFESVFNSDDKKLAISLYVQWIDICETEMYIKLCEAIKPLNDEARSTVLDYLPYTSGFREQFIIPDIGDKEYKARLNACIEKKNEIISKLAVIGFFALR